MLECPEILLKNKAVWRQLTHSKIPGGTNGHISIHMHQTEARLDHMKYLEFMYTCLFFSFSSHS